METRNVKVSMETAKRWYQQGGEFKEMALSAYSEDELNPIRNEWESKVIDYGAKFVSGWYLGDDSVYKETNEENTDKSTFRTEKQALSALAYAQLTQLMALPEYNGDWIADWTDGSPKYCIVPVRDELKLEVFFDFKQNICFRNKSIAELFLSKNYDLLMQYSELD